MIALKANVGGGFEGIGPLGNTTDFGLDLTANKFLALFNKFLSNFIGLLTVIAGIYFIFQFIFGAYAWITAGSETQKIQEAQKKILNAILGLIIVIATIFFVDLIGSLIGLKILSPGEFIKGIWNP